MKDFLDWLREAMDRLDGQFDLLSVESSYVEQVFDAAGKIAEEAGKRALRAGLTELHNESLGLVGASDPQVVQSYLGRCVDACLSRLPSEQPPQSHWLPVEQAAPLLGISAATLKEWCNYIDPQTGKYAPKIEHTRVGTRGRPNMRNGRRGKILIHRDVVAKFVADRTETPLAAPTPKASVPRRATYQSIFYSPRPVGH